VDRIWAFAGALPKLIMPGKDPGGVIVTILIGIAGAVIGGFIANALGFGSEWFRFPQFPHSNCGIAHFAGGTPHDEEGLSVAISMREQVFPRVTSWTDVSAFTASRLDPDLRARPRRGALPILRARCRPMKVCYIKGPLFKP
jgi:uncharacterized membrane protein YeaQ/YmgE (transglycosylase-associated protein family)